MTRDCGTNRRQVAVAAAVAGIIMLTTGMGYRVLAARLAAPGDVEPISFEMLERFPMQFGDWTGQEAPMDAKIVVATDTDAHISRHYIRRSVWQAVRFYVASGVKARDLMPHRPEVCYTGAGWTLTDKRSAELPLGNGTKLPCNVMQFSRGTWDRKRVVVLDYYIVDGQYCKDVALLRSKAWRGAGRVDYVAQVEVIASVSANLNADDAENLVRAFGVESALPTLLLFKDRGARKQPVEDHNDTDEVLGGAESE